MATPTPPAPPATIPAGAPVQDPTTIPLDEAGKPDKHVATLRKKYDDLAADVNLTAPNTPERHKAMEEKKAAFAEYKRAADASHRAAVVASVAEQKQQSAEAAAREATAAKKAAAEAAKHRSGSK